MNVEDRSAVVISEIWQIILRLYNRRDKLIAQAYYGAAVMNGSRNGVQALIKREYPHAHFLHCYAHQLNLVVKRMCSDISLARIFLYNAFQSHLIDGATAESYVSEFFDAVSKIRRNISFKGDEGSLRRDKTLLILISAAKECCDALLLALTIHLNDSLRSKHLATFSLLHLIFFQ